MENKDLEFDLWDPAYSEYQPLRDDIKQEIQNLMKPLDKKSDEDTGFCASVIRKMMPCKLIGQNG